MMFKLIQNVSRLSLEHAFNKNISTNSKPLLIKTTPLLFAEPLKKKKRLDPAIIKAREERKKKKIEKQIRRLERNARQYKPIDELEVPMHLIDKRERYSRKLAPPNPEVLEERALLEKRWANYRREQLLADIQMIDRIALSQQKALDELKKESLELYDDAIQIVASSLPTVIRGPVSTPPISNYDSPDGEYLDVSKKWE